MGKIAISAGHTKGTGAQSCDGISEHAWNSQLALLLVELLEKKGHKVLLLHRSPSLSYTAAMRALGRSMRRFGAQASLELHFNSAQDSRAHGFEFLHWWRSKKGEALAKKVSRSFASSFPDMAARGGNDGARSLWFHRWNERRAYSGRGGAYCYLTPCPAVICEPFFASNPREWEEMRWHQHRIASAYCDGLDSFLKQ